MNYLKKRFNLFIAFFSELSIFLFWVISVVFLLYLTIAFLLAFFFPEFPISINETLFTLSNRELGIYIGFSYIVSLFTIVVRVAQKRMKYIFFGKLQKDKIILTLATSVFLAHFYASSLNLFAKTYPIVLLFYFLFFIFTLPSVIDLYRGFGYSSFRNIINSILAREKELKPNMEADFFRHIRNHVVKVSWYRIARLMFIYGGGFLLITFIISATIATVIIKSYEYALDQRLLKESLSIVEVNPEITTVAEKVNLIGYNFGFRENPEDKLLSSYGEIKDFKLWTDKEIIFVVPLHWQVGNVAIWVEKAKPDQVSKLQKSNLVNLTIASRWEFYTEDTDYTSYSQIINKVSKKIKRIIFLKESVFE